MVKRANRRCKMDDAGQEESRAERSVGTAPPGTLSILHCRPPTPLAAEYMAELEFMRKKRILAEAEPDASVLDGAAQRVAVELRHGLGRRVHVFKLDKAHRTVGLEPERELAEATAAAEDRSELVLDLRKHRARGVARKVADEQRVDGRMVVPNHIAAGRTGQIRTRRLLRRSHSSRCGPIIA
ncbi:hypothetical protein L1887_53700 [Cichorium endivia]|nr:hypothetical protein L1887_53700 [Cichorium endivia]